ncbi:endonuclease domain-containing protein [Sphingomonas sp. AOB5]|uniref:endonuclease domain-containing protein n=1 Tax=Sphingomonas sp. AOB5 TaxID=3034017 RepID=UPI003211EAB5
MAAKLTEGEAMQLSGPRPTIQKAKKLRAGMTLPEVLLWQALRKRPGGLKFRRQHPAGPYILDFYCDTVRLCVEIDGEAHDRGDRPQRDEARDDWLARKRVRTLRIPAREILADLDAVVRHIIDFA